MPVENFTPNATYEFCKGKLNEEGVINFGEYSEIERSIDTGVFPLYKLYKIHELQELGNAEKIVDFEGYIEHVGEVHEVGGKGGKTYQRQLVNCCDPSTHFLVTVTMWDNFLVKETEGFHCVFTGFKHKIYCESRQLNSTVFSKITCEFTAPKLPEGVYEWTHLSLLYKPRSLSEIKAKLAEIPVGQTLYSTVRLELGEFAADECFQELCFDCNGQLQMEEMRKRCRVCGKDVEVANKRLLFRFYTSDGTEEAKIKMYNYVSEKLLGWAEVKETAEEVMAMTRKDLSKLLTGKTLKLTMTSNIVVYEDTKY